MQGFFILALVAATSLAAALTAWKGWRWSGRTLIAGVAAMLEGVGAGLIFFVVNLLVALLALLAARAVTRAHVSLYLVNDIALLALSLVQGLAFQGWRHAASSGRDERA